jgi:hypothetical protein
MKAKGTWGWTPLSAKYKQQLQAAGLPDPDLDPNLQPPDADKAIAAPKLDAFEE